MKDVPKSISTASLYNFKPSSNTGVTDSHEHLHGTVDGHYLFSGGAQITVIRWFNLFAPLPGETDLLARLQTAPVSGGQLTIRSVARVPIDICTQ